MLYSCLCNLSGPRWQLFFSYHHLLCWQWWQCSNNIDTMREVSAISLSYVVAHAIVLQDRLVQLKEMEWKDLQTTDDSPFTSALTTPIRAYILHEALGKDLDGSAFDLKAVGKGIAEIRGTKGSWGWGLFYTPLKLGSVSHSSIRNSLMQRWNQSSCRRR